MTEQDSERPSAPSASREPSDSQSPDSQASDESLSGVPAVGYTSAGESATVPPDASRPSNAQGGTAKAALPPPAEQADSESSGSQPPDSQSPDSQASDESLSGVPAVGNTSAGESATAPSEATGPSNAQSGTVKAALPPRPLLPPVKPTERPVSPKFAAPVSKRPTDNERDASEEKTPLEPSIRAAVSKEAPPAALTKPAETESEPQASAPLYSERDRVPAPSEPAFPNPDAITVVATPVDLRSSIDPRWVHRMAASMAGAAAVALVAAALDTWWARRAASESPPWLGTWLADLGLVAPVACAVGCCTGAASLFLHPRVPPSLARLKAAFEPEEPRKRLQLCVLAALAPLAFVACVFAAARAALPILAWDGSPAASGVALGSATVGIVLLGLLAVFGGQRLIVATWRRATPRPLHAALASSLLAFLLVAMAVTTGTTSGGGGTLAMFGVLKRPELDLRASAILLLLVVAAYVAPALLMGIPSIRVRRPPAWLVISGCISLLAIPYAAVGALQSPDTALAIERGAALGKLTLPKLRSLSDSDKDGFSRWFGGGDCNDSNARVNPGADDVPANGADEDCSGKDAEPVEFKPQEPSVPADAKQWVRQKLPPKLNVVMLSVDTLRYDIGFMGYTARPITPNIDALAARSAVFTHAYAIASYTGKSVGPTVIGKYTSETNRGWSHFNLFPKDLFVQEILQKAGIYTISCQGYWYFFNKNAGLGRGFDVVDSSAAPAQAKVEGDRSSSSDKLGEAVISQLSKPELEDRQFYLWAHFTDPHVEYVKHDEFDFGNDSRALYDSEVAFVDKHVGRVLEFIAQSKFRDRTVIILWSDHGEAFGEHGMIRHGFELWEPLVRVPWMVYVPGIAAHRIDARRSLVDLVATLLDLFGVPEPTGKDALSGESVLLDVVPPPKHEPSERPVFIDMSAGPFNADRQAFIEGDLKVMASGGQPIGLYDLKNDPGEEKNLLKDKKLSEKAVGRFKAFRRELRVINVKPQ